MMDLSRKHLRETVEVVGVVSIVASLLLVAWEVRQSNRIAATQIEIQLSQGYNEINSARAISPEFAKLFPKLEAPESHLVTATENSQMEGLAWHFVNVYWSAQIAHDNGLLGRYQLENFKADAAWLVNAYPGLHKHLIMIYTTSSAMQDMEVFESVAELAARQTAEPSENQ